MTKIGINNAFVCDNVFLGYFISIFVCAKIFSLYGLLTIFYHSAPCDNILLHIMSGLFLRTQDWQIINPNKHILCPPEIWRIGWMPKMFKQWNSHSLSPYGFHALRVYSPVSSLKAGIISIFTIPCLTIKLNLRDILRDVIRDVTSLPWNVVKTKMSAPLLTF